jgi:DNA-directed RNA polymerase subunit RPC12/RpoP
MLINRESNQVEKPYYISFICDNCESKFTHRDLEIVKNKLKLLCKDCSLVNKTFRLRQLKLKNNETILWQSVYERRFIEWCEEKNIPIKNGPKIPFIFQDTQCTYRVDFELPHHKKIVELKDNHCWHKDQVASGRFAAKDKCANKWAQTNGYTFHVVFPKTLSDFKETL